MAPTLDEVMESALPWLDPIPGASETGIDATYEADYQFVSREIGKLTGLGGSIEWTEVREKAGGVLERQSKDIFIACCFAIAQERTQGLRGLGTGLMVVAEVLGRFWTSAYPKSPKARERALNLVSGYAPCMPNQPVLADDKEFALVAAHHFGEMEMLRCNTDERTKDLLVKIRKIPVEPRTPAKQGSAGSEQSAPVAGPVPIDGSEAGSPPEGRAVAVEPKAPTSQVQDAPDPASEEAATWLTGVGRKLQDHASRLRSIDPRNPLAYRLLRTGMWLHLDATPKAPGRILGVPVPRPAERVLATPPPPRDVRMAIEIQLKKQDWKSLLSTVEETLPANRLWLDLQWVAWKALEQLGPDHEPARRQVLAQARDLLTRMPDLPGMAFEDKTAVVWDRTGEDKDLFGTRDWIEKTVMGSSGQPSETAGPEPDEATLRLDAAARSGDIAQLEKAVSEAPSERLRFEAALALSLELSKGAHGGKSKHVALGILADLVRLIDTHRLDTWEPRLAARCLRTFVDQAKADGGPKDQPAEVRAAWSRLCRLDPKAAKQVVWKQAVISNGASSP